ncbi:MAG: GspE/PulE family protein, partial [Verrucomicrobiota bacterium]
MDAKQTTEIFVERGLLDGERAAEFQHLSMTSGAPIEQILVDQGVVDERAFEQVLAETLGHEAYDLSAFQPEPSTLQLIPSGLARLHGALPVSGSGNTIFVALADPLNSSPLEDLRFALGREIVPVVSYPPLVRSLIRDHYGSGDDDIGEMLAQFGGELSVVESSDSFNAENAAAEANAAPIIKYVDLILDKAIAARASDIHFEPFENEFKIRYRVDGALYEMDPPPFRLALPVTSRV